MMPLSISTRPIIISICFLNLIKAQSLGSHQSKCSRQFTCISGECIESFNVCDGAKDCKDGSDETFSLCSRLNIECPGYSFHCAYGACVARSAKCNGITDCADNSDELLSECRRTRVVNNTCSGDEFQCNSGQCIDRFETCDGIPNCKDGSDESITECINIDCPTYLFRCFYGACINRNLKCDGNNDCHDGSDEDEDICMKAKPIVPPKPTLPPVTTTEEPPTSDSCPLPKQIENGRYAITGCSPADTSNRCKGVPGTLVDHSTPIVVECNKGFSLPEGGNVSFCFFGRWLPPLEDCAKFCKPLISTSLDVSCFSQGEEISCENPLPPKTKVSASCKPSYYISHPGSGYTTNECDISGKWDVPLIKCAPDCGKPNYEVEQPLISFGQPAIEGSYPWHAGLYLRKNGGWSQACGGTIISEHVILTAAHCVYDSSRLGPILPEAVKVAVGKYSRSWDIQDLYEERRDVSDIFMPRAYRGLDSSYQFDIAVLDVVSTIIFNNFVMPACLGFYDSNVVPQGALGTVVGWGLTENQRSSETLQFAKLPYVSYNDCLKLVRRTFQRFITYDKFCAGYTNGTGVQEGDSGGGITFLGRTNKNQHYIHGIVSVKPRDEDTVAAFTNITDHKQWLEGVLRALQKKHIT